ncbi:pyridoxal phosphate-dependent transferase [Radiomyces spectabilis]|uniref:pyridoxal phosphate-dependent transferase n=1 Tax=Radiomyces spectabilis TaxID=64574 RepID=UPI00221E9BC8|nr:pyridoxal phosphate-dependent transferase [Radiomyces spectabilis]KAI8388757.1 pyridoxal phosphate-dependent transferase [Radiomyces spectabilis]
MTKQANEFVTECKSSLARGVAVASDLLVDRAVGCYVYMTDGQAYLDLASGIGVTSTGHCHPTVVKAVQEQAAKISHAQVNMFYHQPMLQLVQRLRSKVPPSLDTFFFWNSGSEAVEAAVKLARQATNKQNIIVFSGGHHGRTIGAMALTSSKSIFSAGFGPLMSGVHTVDFPYEFRCPAKDHAPCHTGQHCVDETLRQLELLLQQRTAPEETAAILLEPVLGEGGYVPAPPGFFQALRTFCDRHNILMIVDEVQTGFGRTGKMFAIEHWPGVEPDILVMAKGIASGYPLSAIVSRKALMDQQPPGSMGGTYAGNAVACAAALATLDVFEEERLLENVNQRSEQMFKELREKIPPLLPESIQLDIRGLGLMIGLEFRNAPTGFATRITKEAREQHHMIIITASVYETLRMIPPLIISESEVTDAINRLAESIRAAVQAMV